MHTIPVLKLETFNEETSFLITNGCIKKLLDVLKHSFVYQYKVLTCISGVDYPNNTYRFQLVYELLSLKYNSRIRIKTVLTELTPMETVEAVFIGAAWWECEIWDMFGVFFAKPYSLTRLLTDYGFQGHPLRKDFPLTGFLESRFNYLKNRVLYEKLELAQEYRIMSYLSPWEILRN